MPADNPFFGAAAGRDEIYAYGLRNPWRFSFDRATGDLYAGDVGQGAVEEIDIVTLGGNYGWRVWEGSTCTGNDPSLCSAAGFEFPIAEYGHTGGRCSVIGGYVYRGAGSDLARRQLRLRRPLHGRDLPPRKRRGRVLLDSGPSLSSFGEDAGEDLLRRHRRLGRASGQPVRARADDRCARAWRLSAGDEPGLRFRAPGGRR